MKGPLEPLNGEQLEQRLRQELLGKVSHKLRTPLTVILGYSELLIDGLAGPLTAQQSDYLTRMQLSGQELLRMLDELLQEAKQVAPPPAP